MAEEKELSRSVKLGAKVIRATLQFLQDNGGEMSRKDLMDALEKRVEFNDWERATSEKTGTVRWEFILGFYSIEAAKAGYLIKNKGVWYVTPEGQKALQIKDDRTFMNSMTKAYAE